MSKILVDVLLAKQAAAAAIREHEKREKTPEERAAEDDVIATISANIRRLPLYSWPVAKWEKLDRAAIYQCGNCLTLAGNGGRALTMFCPNCGAEMKNGIIKFPIPAQED